MGLLTGGDARDFATNRSVLGIGAGVATTMLTGGNVEASSPVGSLTTALVSQYRDGNGPGVALLDGLAVGLCVPEAAAAANLVPLPGQRPGTVTDPRTWLDLAPVIQEGVDVHSPEAEILVRVMDTWNTPGPARLSVALEPAAAKRRADQREIHDPPPHGSGVNMAEIEGSVMGRQCWAQRIPEKGTRTEAAAAGEARRNRPSIRSDGRFPTADARIQWKRLYPSILP